MQPGAGPRGAEGGEGPLLGGHHQQHQGRQEEGSGGAAAGEHREEPLGGGAAPGAGAGAPERRQVRGGGGGGGARGAAAAAVGEQLGQAHVVGRVGVVGAAHGGQGPPRHRHLAAHRMGHHQPRTRPRRRQPQLIQSGEMHACMAHRHRPSRFDSMRIRMWCVCTGVFIMAKNNVRTYVRTYSICMCTVLVFVCLLCCLLLSVSLCTVAGLLEYIVSTIMN